MADNRNIFERLSDLETMTNENNELLSKILNNSEKKNNQQTNQKGTLEKISDQQIVFNFLKTAKKSLRWAGSKSQFNKSKRIAIISCLALIVVGIILTIISSIAFDLYSTFTLFENIWLFFSVALIVYMLKNKQLNEMNHLAKYSPDLYAADKYFMPFSIGNKKAFKVFKVICIVAILCNILCVWVIPEAKNKVLVTIWEILFLGTVIFSMIMTSRFYGMYLIPYAEGNNYTTNEKIVLVSLLDNKGLITEEQLKARAPALFE